MALFDFLTSTKRPPSGTAVLAPDEVKKRLMNVARPTAPYRIIDGASENVDIIAEWKIVDASWYEVFAKAGLSKSFRILLKLHPEKNEVHAGDREYTVSWSAGVPTMKLAASAFKGQSQQVEFGKAYGFTEKLESGQIYNYRFDTSEIKKPLQEAVTSCGWIYKGVAFGKL
jgi:hypothetical protein